MSDKFTNIFRIGGFVDGEWREFPAFKPEEGDDSRCVVWLVDKDGMAWWGVRIYNAATRTWWNNSVMEEATVTHFIPAPTEPRLHVRRLTKEEHEQILTHGRKVAEQLESDRKQREIRRHEREKQ